MKKLNHGTAETEEVGFQHLRAQMVREQIVSRGIKDKRVMEAMLRIPRHKFVPASDIKSAYEDKPVPIGYGQTISQPYMAAVMTESLSLAHEDVVLEIGTGSGYQTALLAELGKRVYTVERIQELSLKAQTILDFLGYENVRFLVGDGIAALVKDLPMFDVIIVTAASPSRPDYLFEYLNPGGRVVVPIGDSSGQMLTRFIKTAGKIEQENICRCIFVPLIGQYGWAN